MEAHETGQWVRFPTFPYAREPEADIFACWRVIADSDPPTIRGQADARIVIVRREGAAAGGGLG